MKYFFTFLLLCCGLIAYADGLDGLGQVYIGFILTILLYAINILYLIFYNKNTGSFPFSKLIVLINSVVIVVALYDILTGVSSNSTTENMIAILSFIVLDAIFVFNLFCAIKKLVAASLKKDAGS